MASSSHSCGPVTPEVTLQQNLGCGTGALCARTPSVFLERVCLGRKSCVTAVVKLKLVSVGRGMVLLQCHGQFKSLLRKLLEAAVLNRIKIEPGC